MKSVYLVIAHGSREEEGNRAFFEFLEKFRRCYPHRKVDGAFLGLAKPSVPEALAKCLEEGAKEIFIIPLMLFPGRHVKEDIPRLIEEAKARHPRVDFHYAGPLADHALMLELLEAKAKTLLFK